MSNRYIGGVVTETTNVAQSPWSGSWTPQAAYQGVGQNNWPLWYDPYFNYVTLLLHGDGTNAAQNNTFLDSSTNNFTITRNGSTTQGTFTPFSQAAGYWGNYFNGSSYLSIPTATQLQLGTGDFTIEYWDNHGTQGTNFAPQVGTLSGAPAGTWRFGTFSNLGGLYFAYHNGSQFIDVSFGTTAYNDNTWRHFAISRQSGVVRAFVNGTQVGTNQTITQDFNSTNSVYIGAESVTPSYFTGYISNLRIVKGTAVYTSNFTPSTTPLTAISGTSLLTCQSNRFIDNSTNIFAITANGTPSIQAFSPFVPTAAYTAAVNGGSGYFNGSGDYLQLPSGAASPLGTSDFTWECWVYRNAVTDATYADALCCSSAGISGFGAGVDPSGYVGYAISGTVGLWNIRLGVDPGNPKGSIKVPLNTWTHIALVRSGSTFTGYVNGQVDQTFTSSSSISNLQSQYYVAHWHDGYTRYWNGYISGMRFVIGTAVYTSAFTPPTAPLTAITNTSLLLSCTNAGIYDNAIKNDLETVGNAQISTSVKKYGTGSMYFDGSGGYAVINKASPILDMATGNFTLECWFYPLANGAVPYGNLLVGGTSWTTGSGGLYYDWGNTRFTVHLNGLGTNPILVTGTAALSTWHHVALVRNGTTLSLYLDGTFAQSMTISSSATITFNNQGNTHIGGGGWDGASGIVNGYIDDLRVTKGIARYTANFTPPTQAFQNQ